LLGHFCSFSHY